MRDSILKVITKNKEVRAYIAKTTDLVRCASEVHDTSKTASAALGRALSANVIMAADLKNDNHTISLQFRTEGPIGNIITYSNGKCEVKGYVSNPQVELPIRADGKIDVGGALTLDGTLTVVKDIGMKELYSGTIQLTSGEIAEDITYYYAQSEQIPTAVALGVLIDKDSKTVLSAGGLMIQLLPEASEETISKIESILSSGFSISKLLAKEEYVEEAFNAVFGDMEYEILDQVYPRFKCDCSKERFKRGLFSLGKEEIDKLVEENENIHTQCYFCNKDYEFNLEELKKLQKSY